MMATVVTNISDNNSSEPLSVVQGGTGFASCVQGDIVYASGTNTFSKLAIGVTNTALRSTGSAPIWDGTNPPFFTSTSASSALTAAVSTGYLLTSGSTQTVTLPTTFVAGAQIAVQSVGAGGFILKAGTGTTIQYGTQPTSSGGTLSSSNRYDNCFVIGIVANTTWSVTSALTSGFAVT
jgi:hypothetical protein